ncbi:toll-like receptor 7 [Belonocnema kinseyi]|uniref:toll-like receptor 7 n=1 Tax=Belonocnema kinseyi TaxID=2817044 RepID=UPI00143D7C3A|nr:toll-like receptor 7 [Belonocnema kinseyi]
MAVKWMFELKCYGIIVSLFCIIITMFGSVRGSCHWSMGGNETHSAICTLRSLDPSSVAALFPSLDGAFKLRLSCSTANYFESIITGESWHRLSGLDELVINGCKLLQIPDAAFQPLADLKRLKVRTLNQEWNIGRTLELASDALAGLRELQILEIVDSNLRALPPNVLCGLGNLQTLNLTGNQFRGVEDVGLAETRANRADCRADIRVLDFARNEIRNLPEESPLSGLRQLQELYLQHNEINEIASDALTGLTNLRIFNASFNDLHSLPEGIFAGTRDLREIHLQYNQLRELPRGSFTRLEQLLVLNLAGNHLESDQVDESTFLNLIRLIVLDLSYNLLTRIDAKMFKDLFFLQILDLRNNSISYVESNAFLPLYNLHTLELSENKITSIGPQLFNGLFVLNRLTLSANSIATIDPLAFRNSSDLKELDLSGNELTSIPEALRDLAFLKTLDLGENKITDFQNGSFRNLNQLTGLRLIGNEIGNLSRGMLWDLPNLQILNLARNKVQHVERETFERNVRLEAIRLDGNFLSDINGVFTSIVSLLLLNLSENHIEWFDYAFIPNNLKWLDIHGNFIESLGNYYEIRDLRVRTLDASHNRVTELVPLSVPDSVELLFINNNYISVVRPNTFTGKVNLTRVDMYANMIEMMELTSLRLTPVLEDKLLPEFYIGGNPFNCNCSMDWLPVINNISALRQYPRVMDLDNAMCRVSGPRGSAVIPAYLARPEQFLCRYETHCFALCHCCDFDACDCEMTCPLNCKCYHDQTWNTNVVDCSGLGTREIPRRIPMDATEVYLDGNDLRELQNHVFIGRKNMQVLYVNASGIESIQNRTFNGLNNLQILHLEDNKIHELKGFEFEHLSHLRELYLQNNIIASIGNLTLLPLRSLEILHLEGNQLVTFSVWQATLNTRLVQLSLGNNPWSCRCKFLQELTSWVSDHFHKVTDTKDVWCYNKDAKPPYRRRLTVNETVCSDYFTQGGVIDNIMISDYLPMVAATLSAVLLVLVLTVLAFIFREPVRTWAYSKYGVRFWTKGSTSESKDRLYDGYFCYSPKDEDFVVHSLVDELEHGVRGLRLCLHHRDLPCLRTPSSVILEAAEASRRIVIVLTRNFLHSEWSCFEFREAMHEALRGRLSQLIVIQAGAIISKEETDHELRPYIRSAMVISWGEKRFWEKLRYMMPTHDRHKPSLYRNNVNTYTLESRSEKECTSTLQVSGNATGNLQLFQDSPELLRAPPAYSSTALFGRDNGAVSTATIESSTNPSTRLTMNHAYQDPILSGLNDSSRRPLSEHIYSSIDSDYSTLEKNAWRQHNAQQQQSGHAYLV